MIYISNNRFFTSVFKIISYFISILHDLDYDQGCIELTNVSLLHLMIDMPGLTN